MWNFKVLAVAATTVVLCLICELDAQKVVYIYDPPGAESEIYAQSHSGPYRSLPVRSIPQQQLQSPEHGQQIDTADAIRIIDPPKYVRNHHREEEPARSAQPFPNHQNPFGRGSTFKGPSYLPLANKPTSNDQVPRTLQSNYREHLGLQNPTPEIIRGQIGNLKERQKIYFPSEDNERPVRTKYRVKPVVEDEPIYGQSAYKPNRQNYRAGEDEFVVGNTFVVADNAGGRNAQTAPRSVTPYKHLASVRHEDNIRHQPRDGINPRVKERLRTQKTHTVYAEQGYDDQNFQNGNEQRYTTQFTKHRSKRATNNFLLSRQVERVEELPIALSLVSDQGQKLVGQDLLKYISNLIQDSKQLIPQQTSNGSEPVEEMDSIIVPRKGFQELYEKSVKRVSDPQNPTNHQPSRPIYLPVNPNSPRAEKLQGAPNSPYHRTKAINCDYSQDLQQNGKKKKTGQQIECLKEKYFGKEALDEKFYQDEQLEQVGHPGANGENPSFLVYDDVMQTIESSRVKASPRYEGSQFGIDVNPETARFSEASLPIFDITKYFPQVYMIKPSGKVYGIRFKPNATPNIYNDEVNVPKTSSDAIKTPPKNSQYDTTIEEREQHNVRTFEEPISHQEESQYAQQYQQEQKFTQSPQQQEPVRQHVQHQEVRYTQQPQPQQQPQHPQQPQQQQQQRQQHRQNQPRPHQQQQQPQQQPQQQQHLQVHHQEQRLTHQVAPNHYQHHFVQHHPPSPQHRRPEMVNYSGYGPNPAPHGHPNPHGNPQRVSVPVAHIIKFVREDAIRPHKERI